MCENLAHHIKIIRTPYLTLSHHQHQMKEYISKRKMCVEEINANYNKR